MQELISGQNPILHTYGKLFIPNEVASEALFQLGFEETFYLTSVLNYIVVIDSNGENIDLQTQWELFIQLKMNFISSYFAYKHYREGGWVVKCGINYGVDLVLYKDSPEAYHSTFGVTVYSIDTFGNQITAIPQKTHNTIGLLSNIRVVENASKSNDYEKILSCLDIIELELSRWVIQKKQKVVQEQKRIEEESLKKEKLLKQNQLKEEKEKKRIEEDNMKLELLSKEEEINDQTQNQKSQNEEKELLIVIQEEQKEDEREDAELIIKLDGLSILNEEKLKEEEFK